MASLGIKDLCSPNPCGDNTRCISTLVRSSPVISCECLIGYQVPTGGDPFDGCIEKLLVGSRKGGRAATPRIISIHTTFTHLGMATQIPVLEVFPKESYQPVTFASQAKESE